MDKIFHLALLPRVFRRFDAFFFVFVCFLQVRGCDERSQLQLNVHLYRVERNIGAVGVQEAQQSLSAEPPSAFAGTLPFVIDIVPFLSSPSLKPVFLRFFRRC